jgi:hypothetical protein
MASTLNISSAFTTQQKGSAEFLNHPSWLRNWDKEVQRRRKSVWVLLKAEEDTDTVDFSVPGPNSVARSGSEFQAPKSTYQHHLTFINVTRAANALANIH